MRNKRSTNRKQKSYLQRALQISHHPSQNVSISQFPYNQAGREHSAHEGRTGERKRKGGMAQMQSYISREIEPIITFTTNRRRVLSLTQHNAISIMQLRIKATINETDNNQQDA